MNLKKYKLIIWTILLPIFLFACSSGKSEAEDLKDAEQFVQNYFTLLNQKKFDDAVKVTKDKNIFGDFSVESISLNKLTLSPPPSQTKQLYVIDNVKYVQFSAELTVEPKNNPAWTQGANTRFVTVVFEDNAWKIAGIKKTAE